MDTLQAKKDFTSAGFTDQQAEALVVAMNTHLATKEDLRELRQDLLGNLRELRKDTQGEVGTLRKDMQVQMADLERRLSRRIWMAAGVIAALLTIFEFAL